MKQIHFFLILILLYILQACQHKNNTATDPAGKEINVSIENKPAKETYYRIWDSYLLRGVSGENKESLLQEAEDLVLVIEDDSLFVIGSTRNVDKNRYLFKKETVPAYEFLAKIDSQYHHQLIFSGRMQGIEQRDSITYMQVLEKVSGNSSVTPDDFSLSGYLLCPGNHLCLCYQSTLLLWCKNQRKPQKEMGTPVILLPWEYDVEEDGSCLTDYLTNEWLCMCEQDDEFYFVKEDYQIEAYYDSVCINGNVKVIRIDSDADALFFINNPLLKEGKIPVLEGVQEQIGPGEEFRFTMNGEDYTLWAEGLLKSDEPCENDSFLGGRFCHVDEYTLFLRTESTGKEEILLLEHYFRDTIARLAFIGDVDGDGKPDFLFRAGWDYYVLRYILILSSKAREEDFKRKAYDGYQLSPC